MLARLCGFLVWALVAASVVFWGLRLFVKGPAAPANALSVAESVAGRGDLTRLFGQPPAPVEAATALEPALASRFRLYGVMAPRSAAGASATQGLALIAVDGKAARPYAVGASVDNDLVVQSVSLRTAAIGPARGTTSVLLELAPPAPPATGVPTASVGPAPPLPASPPPPSQAVPALVPAILPGAPTAAVPGSGVGRNFRRGPATQ
ncbi:MAG: hypothetical protein ABIX46_12350 [Burkholderiaceae bacterium]